MNELALFSGAGGGLLGSRLLGWSTRCAVEINPYCRKVLLARQRDGMLERFPIWDDVRTFDGNPWRGSIDVISGGFPCQDISAAGKGAGIKGAKSGLWKEFARIIREVQPRFAFVENSPMLTTRGLGIVLADLAALGFNARWGVFGAHHAGAPHKRDRLWIVATHSDRNIIRQQPERKRRSEGPTFAPINGEPCTVAHPHSAWELQSQGDIEESRRRASDVRQDMANTNGEFVSFAKCAERTPTQYTHANGSGWWQTEPDVGRVVNGMASRLDRLTALGNGQVPSVAQMAWEYLTT